jgi:type I restriction enzyme M protein
LFRILRQKKKKLFDYITGKEIPNKPENREAKVPFEKRLVEEYGYPKEVLEPEFRIQKGSALIGPADIIIFYPNKPHIQENIFLVVENKRKNRKDGLDQLKSYLAPCKRAQWGVWFNGEEIEYLRVTDKGYKKVFNIPKFGETLGLPRKDELKEATELVKIFGIIHNHIYANDGLSSQEAFNEVLKLLFIKIEDEKDFSDSMVKFGITEQEYDEIISGKENGFRKRIGGLFEKVKRSYKDVFNTSEQINLKTTTLAFVVGQIQNFDLRYSNRDVKGAAFQKFVYAHQRGERGQFFTPDPIIELTVHFLDPRPDELILDPACGTGGFLVRDMKYVWEKYFRDIKNPKDKRDAELDYALRHLHGIEINPGLSKVAKMRMILEDDGYTGIFSENSLEEWDVIKQSAWEAGVKGDVKKGGYDIVMTNPPFGTQGKITDRTFLERFDLGWQWKEKKDGKWEKQNKLFNAQVPDIIFIERCLDFLKDGGRMGIVLPDGDLTNSTLAYVRDYLRNKVRILAIVSLPNETFIPHGAGIKASVVFLKKVNPIELAKLKKQSYEIFFGVVEKIGYEGDKNGTVLYKRDEDGQIIYDGEGNPVIDEDITDLVKIWNAYKGGKLKAKIGDNPVYSIMSYKQVNDRIDAAYYRPEFLELDKWLKNSKVPLIDLGELITEIKYGTSDKVKYTNSGVPFLRVTDINQFNTIDPKLGKFISEKTAERLKEYRVKEKEILISRTGTIGVAMYITSTLHHSVYGSYFIKVAVDESKTVPLYIAQFLNSGLGRLQSERLKSGGIQTNLTIDAIKSIKIPFVR